MTNMWTKINRFMNDMIGICESAIKTTYNQSLNDSMSVIARWRQFHTSEIHRTLQTSAINMFTAILVILFYKFKDSVSTISDWFTYNGLFSGQSDINWMMTRFPSHWLFRLKLHSEVNLPSTYCSQWMFCLWFRWEVGLLYIHTV